MRLAAAVLLVAITAAAGGETAFSYAPAPPPRSRASPRLLAGRWTVKFANGVVQTSELRPDGTASVAEPARSSGGKAEVRGDAVVITFDDGRVERWSVSGTSVVVEHWFPASRYPSGPSVRGAARRLPR
jgi:hypothetical protein